MIGKNSYSHLNPLGNTVWCPDRTTREFIQRSTDNDKTPAQLVLFEPRNMSITGTIMSNDLSTYASSTT